MTLYWCVLSVCPLSGAKDVGTTLRKYWCTALAGSSRYDPAGRVLTHSARCLTLCVGFGIEDMVSNPVRPIDQLAYIETGLPARSAKI